MVPPVIGLGTGAGTCDVSGFQVASKVGPISPDRPKLHDTPVQSQLHFGETESVSISIVKERATPFPVACQRPADGIDIMRTAHMRQAHN